MCRCVHFQHGVPPRRQETVLAHHVRICRDYYIFAIGTNTNRAAIQAIRP